MYLAIDMEDLKVRLVQYCGGTIDIAKLFDQISRVLVEVLAKQAGMPNTVLSAYMRFQEHHRHVHCIDRGPYSRSRVLDV